MALINEKLIAQYKIIHSQKRYGISSVKFLPLIKLFIQELKPKKILDYGCGQSNLYNKIFEETGIKCDRYDPAIKEISVIKEKYYDFLICTDVMEHIPEVDCLDVLNHIKSLSNTVFFYISTRAAVEILPNGDNAHCTVKDYLWWENMLSKVFPIVKLLYINNEDGVAFTTWKTSIKNVYNNKG